MPAIFKKVVFMTMLFCHSVQAVPPVKHSKSPLPDKNQQVINFVERHGKAIAPTYESAVCTELLIGVLKHFIPLQAIDRKRIRIICNENVYELRKKGSPIPKGVYYALTANNTGSGIERLEDVLPGDFVQFWYQSWGHCGIVKSLNLETHTMELYSSFPTTDGYGIQTFSIPQEVYFVRLKN